MPVPGECQAAACSSCLLHCACLSPPPPHIHTVCGDAGQTCQTNQWEMERKSEVTNITVSSKTRKMVSNSGRQVFYPAKTFVITIVVFKKKKSA